MHTPASKLSRSLPVAVIAVAVLAAGCGGSSKSSGASSSSGAAAPAAASSGASRGAKESVTIASFAYKPTPVTVKVGAQVTFTNQDSAEHTATADSGSALETGTLKQGQSKAVTLSQPGTIAYHCAFHAFMHGTISVVK